MEIAGRLKDPGLTALLKGLAVANPGLCVVTTRERLADLDGKDKTAPQIDLEGLDPDSAVELLRRLQVRGRETELRAAVEEFGRHALTLTLLGNYLHRAHKGDIRQRKEIDLRRAGEYAFRVIEAYTRWLGEGPEVAILRLLGLFDRPAEPASLKALRAEPPIPGLTESLVHISEEDWQTAITSLRDLGLLVVADPREPDTLDAHALVRACFAEELESGRPDAWQEGNRRLYEHLCQVTPDLPDTLEAMQPLYAAIVHGCRAGRQQEAMDEIYWRRILREHDSYSTKKLGAFGSELTALVGFFDLPWSLPSVRLSPTWQAFVLEVAASHLRALGRLAEAVQPMQTSMEMRIKLEKWDKAALAANNLSELALNLGKVPRAVGFGEKSVELANRGGNAHLSSAKTTWADVLHQAGSWEESTAAFREAEVLQAEADPEHPLLYALQGFKYCDLLLSRAEPEDGSGLDLLTGTAARIEIAQQIRQVCREVLERAKRTLIWAEQSKDSLLSLALDHLTQGRAYLGLAQTTPQQPLGLREEDLEQAAKQLDRALDYLRQAAEEEFVSVGLLFRATFRRVHLDFAGATEDLNLSLEISERGSMRLNECDAHLEWARLCRDQRVLPEARQHLARARELVDQTGYKRREREVVWLERELAKESAMKDFFVSFNSADKAWAEWIAWTLEDAGYQVVYQHWDFQPGGNFILKMQEATEGTRKTIAVLSDHYLQALYTQSEWAAAFVDDPRGDKRKLVPLRVAPCSPTGLLKSLIFADLVGLTQDEAKKAVLDAVKDGRPGKPATAPAFPGSPQTVPSAGSAPVFPGATAPVALNGVLAIWKEKLAFLESREAFVVDDNHRFVLMKQIEEAREKIREHGG
ncbi:MAG TPA: toll/interleukin-1 receptor domain-containing protein [Thermoanaerobaculia bacterium]|nr:toll/interleukin-1 receptor domain-containing protein [Thermoanaerobaculia bacterium]